MILITGKKYDVLKELALVWLPALGVMYFALAGIWSLPAAQQVSGTILAVDTFVGVILHLSAKAYATSDARFDGVVNTIETEDKKVLSLDLRGDPEEHLQQDTLVFKVNKGPEPITLDPGKPSPAE